MSKGLELAIALLPSDTPLISMIELNYWTHFSPSRVVIEEDKEHIDDIKWLHPSKGIYTSEKVPYVLSLEGICYKLLPCY